MGTFWGLMIELVAAHLAPFLLVLSRLGGLFVFGPLISSSAIPLRVRAMLLVALSIVLYPMTGVGPGDAPPLDLVILAPLIAQEVMIGLVVGLIASLPLVGVQTAGVSIGQQIGLGIAEVVNPALDVGGNSIGQLLYTLAIGAFLAFGGVEFMVMAIAHTFDMIPLGSVALHEAPVDTAARVLDSAFNLAIRLAMPVLAIIFVESVVVGFIMKTVPSLNILTFGFPIRILLGLWLTSVAVGAIAESTGVALEDAARDAEAWLVETGREGG